MDAARTVFLDSNLSDFQSLASRYDASQFNVVMLTDPANGMQQIQDYLTTHQITAASINVISPAAATDGLFTPRVVFVDPSVADYQDIIAALPANTTAVVLDASQDGIQQIRDYLAHNTGKVSAIDIITDIASMDVVSHGAPGEIVLGSTVLNSDTVAAYSTQLAEIGSHLTSGGDILLYGCDVAAGTEGQQFINQLAQATGADVAASTDATGSAAAGGDWVLEASTGTVETAALQVDSFAGTLNVTAAAFTGINTGSDTGTKGDWITSSLTPTIEGTYSSGTGNAKLYIWTDSTHFVEVTSASANQSNVAWSVGLSLSPGTYTLVASTSNNPNQYLANSLGSHTITIDNATAAPVVALTSDTGSSATDKITKAGGLTVTGTESGASLTYSNNGGGFNSSFSAVEGLNNVVVRSTDAAGNTASTSFSFTLDTTAPALSVSLTTDSTDGGAGHATDLVTNNAALTISALESGAARSFVVDVGAPAGTYTAPAAQGSHIVTVTDTDVAGNATIRSITFNLDTRADPEGDLKVTLPDNLINLSERGAVAYTVAGLNSDASATVTFSDGTHTVTGAGGVANLSTLNDGPITVSISAQDAAGNTAGGAGATLTLDTALTAPTLALASDTTDGVAGHATDRVTSNAALVFGAKDADATRVIKVDGTTVGSYNPASLADGAHTVTVTDTDTAGNTKSASLDFTLDTTLTTPSVALAQDTTDGGAGHNSDRLTSNAALTFSARDADAARIIKVDGTAVGSYNAAALADGAHTVTVTDTDAAGNTKTASIDFTVDTTLTAPTVALAQDTTDRAAGHNTDHLTSNAALVFGAKDADANRVLKVDGVAVGAYDASLLADGAHTVSVTDTDAAGNTKTASVDFTLDTSLTAPTIALTQDTTDGGSGHDTDRLTSNAALSFGAKDADATRVIKVDGAAVANYDAAALADGAHNVVITDTDAAGNTKSASIDFTLDTTLTAPTVALGTDSSDGAAGHDTDRLSNNAALTFGAKDADATRTIKVDGVTVAAYNAASLADGAHNVSVTDTDAAGNAKTASLDFTLDTTLTAPTIALVQDTTDGAVGHDTDHLTSNTALTFGAKDADASRAVKVDGVAVAAYDASALADGAHTVSVTDTDAAGNTKTASLEFTLDTTLTAPTVALTHDTTDGVAGHDTDHLTSNVALTFNAKDADATRVIKVDGTAVASYDASKLADGAHSVSVTDTDAAGNTSSVSLGFTLDTSLTAPTVVLVQDTTDGAPGHDVDHLTSNAALAFNVQDADATRVIKVDGTTVASYDPSLLANGAHSVSVTDTDAAGNTKSASFDFTLDITLTAPTVALVHDTSDGGAGHDADHLTSNAALSFGDKDADANRVIKVDGVAVAAYDASALADGAHNVSVIDTDAAGNTKSASLDFTLDTTLTAPTVSLVQDTSDGGAGHDADHLTSNAALAFGVKDADATRVIKVDGSQIDSYDASTLADGAHSVSVTDTDAAGNTQSATFDFTLDTTLTAPTVALVMDSSDGAAGHDADHLTNNAALAFGAKDADANRVVKVDGVAVAAYDASALADGAHNVSVTDTDAAGNTKSASLDFTLDTTLTAPTIALVQDTTDGAVGHDTDHLTSNAALTFGAKDADASRAIKVDGVTVAAYDASALADGAHTVSVTDTDAAGNTKTASLEFTLDTTLTAPTVALTHDTTDGVAGHDTDHLTSNVALTFNAKDADATRVIKVDGTAVASYDASKLADGAHSVSVTDTDVAGNTSSVSLDFTLDTSLTAPTVALVQDTTDGATGHDVDHLTSNAALAFNLQDADATRVIKVDGSTVASYDPSLLADGAHSVSVTDTDAAGNTKSASLDFTLDTTLTAPTVALVHDTSDGGAGHDADHLTSNAALSFGDKDADANRVIKVDGVAVAAYDASALADGAHNVSVTDTDAAGNTKSASLGFTLDTTLTAPTVSLVQDTSDGGAGHDADHLTSIGALAFGAKDADAARVIKVDGAQVSSYDAATLADGAHSVVVTDTDAAGNSKSATIDFTLDTTLTAPAVTLAQDTTDGGTGHASDHLTSNAALNFNAKDADANRIVKVDGNIVAAYDASALAQGAHNVAVTDTDAAGNTKSASIDFVLDSVITAPTIALAHDTTDGATGHDTDRLTSNAALVFNTKDADASRVVKVDGNTVAAYDPATLADGVHNVSVTDTDAAGNTKTTSIDFTLDTTLTAPTLALVQDTTDGIAGHNTDHLTANAALTFGAKDADAARVITVDGAVVAAYDATSLADGAHHVSVTDTDAAGNSKSASVDFTLDTSLTAPTVALAQDTTDGGAGRDSDRLTSNAALNFGAKDTDATRVIKVDGAAVASYNAAALADGAHTVSVIDTDAAGNSKTASLDFVLDTKITKPAMSLVQDTTDGAVGHDADHLTSNAALSFNGADADAARIIKVDGATVASYDASALADGAHTVEVTDTDAAGNAKSTSFNFVLDRQLTAPTLGLSEDTTDGAAGHASDGVTSKAGLIFGAKDPDAARSITVDGAAVASYDPSKLGDGAHVVVVTDTDAAGNSKSATLNFTLDTTAPATQAIALTIDSSDGSAGHASDKVSSNASLNFGSLEAGATRSFSVDNGAAAASYAAPGIDGAHNVKVTDTDIAGNSVTRSFDFTLDTKADPEGDLAVTVPDPLVSLAERSAVAYSVAGVNADANAVVTFSDGVHSVTGANGLANLSSLSDGTISVSVLATDFAGNTAQGKAASFTLDATAPVFSSAATASVTENTGANQIVYKAAATDAGTFSYSLLANNNDDAGQFSIDASGNVQLAANPDYEAKNNYHFTVVATDLAGNAAQKAVTLNVNDVNEAPTTSKIMLSTVENASILIPVIPDYATDPDANDVVTLKNVSQVTLTWAADSTASTLVNPVTKQVLNLSQVYASATISADGKSISITPSDEFDWASTGQKVNGTMSYSVVDKSGMVSTNTITLTIWGSTADKGKVLNGGNGNDNLVGTDGENVLQGANGNDTLTGGAATDALYGGNGDDKLTGGGGIDYLYGDNGNDTLDGGAARDVLFGGKGNDVLIGGTGADCFVFESSMGTDRVNDFNMAEGDKLYFVDVLSKPMTAHDFVAKYVTHVGNDLLISAPGGQVTLVGVSDTAALENAIVFTMPT